MNNLIKINKNNKLCISSRTTIILALMLILCASLQTFAQTRTSVKGHDPEYGRDLVLRMERFRTCDECPHYEIKIFADGSSMFHGKDAVRFLGKWGDYMLRTRPDSPGHQRRQDEAKQLSDTVVRIARKYATNGNYLFHSAKQGTEKYERIVIERVGLSVPIILDFDLRTAPQDFRDLLQEFEKFNESSRVDYAWMSEWRRPFVSDDQALLYWQAIIGPELCSKMGDDLLTIILYKDGRMSVEGGGRLHKERIPIFWLKKEVADVHNLIEMLRHEMSKYAAIPRRAFTEEFKYVTPETSQTHQMRRHQNLYIKATDNSVLDLASGYFDLWRERRPAALFTEMFDLARYAQQNLPPPDLESIENCQKFPGRK